MFMKLHMWQPTNSNPNYHRTNKMNKILTPANTFKTTQLLPPTTIPFDHFTVFQQPPVSPSGTLSSGAEAATKAMAKQYITTIPPKYNLAF